MRLGVLGDSTHADGWGGDWTEIVERGQNEAEKAYGLGM